jgi:hypothetical protein
LDELAEAVRAARQALSNDPSDFSWSALWSATLLLFRAVEALESSELSGEVTDALAIGLGFSLSRKLVPDDLKIRALLKLLEVTDRANPQTSLDTETQFDETHEYSIPAPRVSAADGLSRIARIADDWPLVRERYTRLLLSDRHPAVRYELVDSLPAIVLHDPDFWQVVETFARDETNRSVLESAIAALSYLPEAYGASVERIVLANADARRRDLRSYR